MMTTSSPARVHATPGFMQPGRISPIKIQKPVNPIDTSQKRIEKRQNFRHILTALKAAYGELKGYIQIRSRIPSGNTDWVQIVRRVDPLMVSWFGIVSGVFVPSGSSRSIAIGFPIRARIEPRFPLPTPEQTQV
jgi:hypothetical protein